MLQKGRREKEGKRYFRVLQKGEEGKREEVLLVCVAEGEEEGDRV